MNDLRVKIDKLSYGGAGIGTADGKIVFVKRGLPGDVVEVEIIKDKKNFSLARVKSIITPSVGRVEPGCPVFGRCGGCQWQDLEYKTQLAEKHKIVRESVERLGGIKETEIHPVVPSPDVYGYRSRIVLSVLKKGKGFSVCFFEEGSERKIPIESCPVANDRINECIERVSQFFTHGNSLPGHPDKVYIASGDEKTGITISFRNKRNKSKRNFDPVSMVITGRKETEIGLTTHGKILFSVPSLFMQSNIKVSRLMADTLLDWTESSGAQYVLDLFCGFGNFTIPVAGHVHSITGVDSNRLATKYAHKNSSLNGVTNAEFITDEANRFLKKAPRHFDTVILDPPREGAKDCMEPIEKMRPEIIIYISCNPATLARDLGMLCSYGYGIKQIKPFDMFPHTFHIECMVLLESKDMV